MDPEPSLELLGLLLCVLVIGFASAAEAALTAISRHRLNALQSEGEPRARALTELANLKKLSPDGTVLPFNLALVHLGLGDRARAIDNLEQALAADSQMMAWLGQDRIFDLLRSEPRFVALVKKLRLNR